MLVGLLSLRPVTMISTIVFQKATDGIQIFIRVELSNVQVAHPYLKLLALIMIVAACLLHKLSLGTIETLNKSNILKEI